MSENRHPVYGNDSSAKNGQLQELYAKLGKAYYEGGFEDPLPELLPFFDRITALKAEMEHAQTAVQEAGGWCSKCGAQLKPGAGFCGNCGQPVGR